MHVRRRCRRSFIFRSSLYFLISLAIGSIVFLMHRVDFDRWSQSVVNDVPFQLDRTDVDDAKLKIPLQNVRYYPEDYFHSSHLACRYPKLTIDNPDIWKHLSPVHKAKPDCESSTNWVYVENGREIVGSSRCTSIVF